MKHSRAATLVVIAILICLVPKADAFFVVWGNGEKIYKVCDVPPQARAALAEAGYPKGVVVGYRQKAFLLFWMPAVQWDGQFVLYEGDTYWRIGDRESAIKVLAELGIPEGIVKKPFFSYVPWLWLVGAGVVGLALLSGDADERQKKKRILEIRNDRRYANALAIALQSEPDGGFAPAVGYLCKQGIKEQQAMSDLTMLMALDPAEIQMIAGLASK